MQVSTRHSGNGPTSGGTTNDARDVTTYISDTAGLSTSSGIINFTRAGSTDNNRVAWQILEYIGVVGGPNEMKVLDNGNVTFGGSDISKDGDTISGGAADDNDVAVIITGVSNPDTGSSDYETGLVTTEWIGGSDVPRFTRTGTGGDEIIVSYAVVEFTGSSWNLQRITHTGNQYTAQSQVLQLLFHNYHYY